MKTIIAVGNKYSLNRHVPFKGGVLMAGTTVTIRQVNENTCMVTKDNEPNIEYTVGKDSLSNPIMTTNTRQIVLNTLCNIYTDIEFLLQFDDKECNRKTFQVMTCKIVRETVKGDLIVHQCLEPTVEYGWSDRPALGSCVIPKASVNLIVYRDNVQLKSTPSLSLYRKGDKIQAMVDDLHNYEHGKLTPQVWREAIVLNTGIVPKDVSRKNYADYPYIEVEVLRTYWRETADGKGEVYDKMNIERFYNAKEIKFAANNIVTV